MNDEQKFPYELAGVIDGVGDLSAYLEIKSDKEIIADIKALTGFKATPAVTLRDYFAANAPECPKWFYEITCSGKEIADQRCIALWRYSYADAMIKEREKRG